MQKFGHFYVTYRNIVQFVHDLWKLDYFEKKCPRINGRPGSLKKSRLFDTDI